MQLCLVFVRLLRPSSYHWIDRPIKGACQVWKPQADYKLPLREGEPRLVERMVGDKRFKTTNCRIIAVYEDDRTRGFILRSANGNYFRQSDPLRNEEAGAAVEPLMFGNAINWFESPVVRQLVPFEEAFPDGVQEW